MQGKATIAGHPIHPMLVPLPIGFFAGASISELMYWTTADTFWPQMSTVLLVFGLISAVVTAIFGYVDFRTAPMSHTAKSTGLQHMLFNSVALLVFAAAPYIRLHDRTATAGGVLILVGMVLLGVSGYLGGHLSYHHGIGVDDESLAASRPGRTS